MPEAGTWSKTVLQMALGKLTIGTVNFGMPYGTVPGSGQVPADQAAAIVRAALEMGVDRFDTAIGYGTAESVLGKSLLRAGATDAKVVTKILPLPDGTLAGAGAARIAGQVREACERLGVGTLDAVLIHRAADLLGDDGLRLWNVLVRVRADGLARRIGVSVYGAAEIDAVSARVTPDIVQLPLSIADQRLVRSGHLSTLAERGVEIHVRSVFLQGVLLAAANAIDAAFASAAPEMAALDEAARSKGISRLALCLAFVVQRPEVSQIVVGVNSVDQFHEVAEAVARPAEIPDAEARRFAWRDDRLLNPSNWPSLISPAVSEA